MTPIRETHSVLAPAHELQGDPGDQQHDDQGTEHDPVDPESRQDLFKRACDRAFHKFFQLRDPVMNRALDLVNADADQCLHDHVYGSVHAHVLHLPSPHIKNLHDACHLLDELLALLFTENGLNLLLAWNEALVGVFGFEQPLRVSHDAVNVAGLKLAVDVKRHGASLDRLQAANTDARTYAVPYRLHASVTRALACSAVEARIQDTRFESRDAPQTGVMRTCTADEIHDLQLCLAVIDSIRDADVLNVGFCQRFREIDFALSGCHVFRFLF